MRLSILLLLMLLPLTVCSADTAMVLAKQQGVTLDQALQQVKKQQQGKVLAAETKLQQGVSVHVIKVLTEEGRVKKIRINAVQTR
ncbi:MAG: hypothetical protein RPR28_03535 [Cycloclasticus sp.]